MLRCSLSSLFEAELVALLESAELDADGEVELDDVDPAAARLGMDLSVVEPVTASAESAFLGWPSSLGSWGAVLASVAGASGCSVVGGDRLVGWFLCDSAWSLEVGVLRPGFWGFAGLVV